MLSKTCTICNKTFTADKIEDFTKFFFRDKKGLHKHNARCKPCCREEKLKLFKKHPEKMNPKWVSKAHQKNCIVCGNEFTAREEKHICCSDECKKFKNKVRRNLIKDELAAKEKKRRKKDIARAKIRNKHYTKEELIRIKNLMWQDYSADRISRLMGRTKIGVQKKMRQIEKGLLLD